MDNPDTGDAVVRFCAAAASNDVDAMIATLAPTAVLVSPVSGRMVFAGHADLRILLGAVFGSVSHLHWRHSLAAGSTRVALADARIGRVPLTDAMVVDLDSDGRILQITPHLRPWLALTLVALALGPKLARHPAVIRRALGPRAGFLPRARVK